MPGHRCDESLGLPGVCLKLTLAAIAVASMTAAAVGAVEGSVIQAISDTDTSDQFERGWFISKSSGAAALDPGPWPRTPTDGVRVEKVRHDDDGHALAGGIAPTALFPEPPPPSEVALRATAATRPAFSGAPLVVLFVYISI